MWLRLLQSDVTFYFGNGLRTTYHDNKKPKSLFLTTLGHVYKTALSTTKSNQLFGLVQEKKENNKMGVIS